jgi:hypothetical protein
MAFIPVPDCAEVVVKATVFGQNVFNTFNFKGITGWGQDEIDDLASLFYTTWVAEVLPELSVDYNLVSVVARDLRTAIGLTSEVATADQGEVAQTSLPINCALAFKRGSNLTGRSARGRVFIGGIPETVYTPASQTISSTFGTALRLALEAIDTALDGIDWTEVIVSRQQAGVPLTTGLVYDVVGWSVVNLVLDSMRRRLPGRGQ